MAGGSKLELDAQIIGSAGNGEKQKMKTLKTLNWFKRMDLKGRVTKLKSSKSLPTTHQNIITFVSN